MKVAHWVCLGIGFVCVSLVFPHLYKLPSLLDTLKMFSQEEGRIQLVALIFDPTRFKTTTFFYFGNRQLALENRELTFCFFIFSDLIDKRFYAEYLRWRLNT